MIKKIIEWIVLISVLISLIATTVMAVVIKDWKAAFITWLISLCLEGIFILAMFFFFND